MAKNEIAKSGTYAMQALEDMDGGLTPEEIAEELGGAAPTYPRVKWPAAGAVSFEVPGDDPESPDPAKELEGVIVWHHNCNVYYADRNSTDSPPDCSSIDGKYGRGNPGGPCSTCPLNEFGSGEGGKGKACSNKKRMYVLTQTGFFPLAVTAPPTTLRKLTDYITSLLQRGQKLCDVVTKITLLKKESSTGQPYSQGVFAKVADLDEETRAKARAYRETIRESIAAGQDVTDEFAEVSEATPFEVDEATGEVLS